MKNGELAQSHEVLPEVLPLHVVYSNNVQPCWPRLRHLDSCGEICPPFTVERPRCERCALGSRVNVAEKMKVCNLSRQICWQSLSI